MALVGSAEVIVRAITSSIRKDIEKAFAEARPAVAKAGKQAGEDFGKNFQSGLGTSISDSVDAELDKAASRSSDQGKRSGDNFGDAFIEVLASLNFGAVGQSIGRDFGNGASRGIRDSQGSLDSAADDSGKKTAGKFTKAFSRFLNSGFATASIAASRAFTSIFATANIAGTGISVLVSGISALVSGLFAIVSAAGVAVSALAALPGVLAAVLQGFAAVKLATKGVGEAFKLGTQAADENVASNGAAATNAYAVADAQKALARAIQDAAYAQAQAADRVADAERDVAEAQREVLQVQKELNAARAEAAENLQQLAFSAEDAVLGEERAQIALEDAYSALVAVQNLPADDRARREAELSYQEAELAYRQAKDRNADLAKEQKKAAKAGVEGSNEVIEARNAIADAENALADRQEALADARAAQAKQAIDSQRAIADAQERLRRALADTGAETAKTASASDKYQEALEKLSPEAQEFVKYLISIRGAFKDLRAAAGRELFPLLEQSIQRLIDGALPALEDNLDESGKRMGRLAAGFSRGIVAGNTLETVLRGNNEILGIFTRKGADGQNSANQFAQVLLRLLEAINPLTKRFSRFVVDLIRSAEAATDTKEEMQGLTDFFNRAGDRASLLGDLLGNLVGLIGDVGKAADPAGEGLLKSLNKSITKLREFIAVPENNQNLKNFFEDAADNTRSISNALAKISEVFLGLGDNPGIAKFFDNIEPAIENFGQLADNFTNSGGGLATFINNLSVLLLAFGDAEGIKLFFDTLNLGFTALFKAVEGITFVIDGIFGEGATKKIFIFVAGILTVARTLSFMKNVAIKAFQILIGGPLGFIRNMVRGETALGRFIAKLPGINKIVAKLRLREVGEQSDDVVDALERQMKVDQEKINKLKALARQAMLTGDALGDMQDGAEPRDGDIYDTRDTPLFDFGDDARQAGADAASQAALGFGDAADYLEFEARQAGEQAAAAVGDAFDQVDVNTPETRARISNDLADCLHDSVRATGTEMRDASRLAGDQFGDNASREIRAALFRLRQTDPAASRAIIESFQRLGELAGEGLEAGLEDSHAEVIAEARRLGAAIIAGTEDALDIASPSRVMRRVGEQAAEGLEDGLEASEAEVRAAGAEVGRAAAQGAESAVAAANIDVDVDTDQAVGDIDAIGDATDRNERRTGKFRGALGAVGGAFKGLAGGALALIGGPFGLLLIAMPLLVAAFHRLYKQSPEFRKFVDGLTDKLDKLKDIALEVFDKKVIPALNRFFRWVNKHMPAIQAYVENAFNKIRDVVVNTLIPTFQNELLPVFKDVFEQVKTVLLEEIVPLFRDTVIPAFQDLVDWVKENMPTFKKIFQGVLKAVQTYITAYIKYYRFLWSALKVALDIAIPLIKNYMKVVGFVIGVIRGFVENQLIPIFNRIVDVVRAVIEIAKPVFKEFSARFKFAVSVIRTVWTRVLKPVFQALRSVFETVGSAIVLVIKGSLRQFENFKRGFTLVKDTATRIFNRVKEIFDSVRDKVSDVVSSASDKFDAFKTALASVRDRVKTIVDRIKDIFNTIKDAVGGAFGDLKSTVGKPINDFIDFLNRHLIGNVNKVTKKFGLELPTLSTIPGYAEGGYTGPGGKYKVAGVVHADEHVTRASSRRAFEKANPGVLDYINRHGSLPRGYSDGRGGLGIPFIDIEDGAKILNDLAKTTVNGVKNVGELISKKGLGVALEKILGGTKGLLNGAGIKRGSFINDWMYGLMDEIARAAKGWGSAVDDKNKGRLKLITSVGGGINNRGWTYPLAGGPYVITSYPGTGHNPANAVDFGSPDGTIVRAAAAGRIRSAIDKGNTSYGKYIVIDHAGGISTLYAHLESFVKTAGQVLAGQTIGISGHSGGVRSSTGGNGAHLHFEINPSVSTLEELRKRGVKFAQGGVARATAGGILSVVAEAGKNERVEPLDRDGMSKRDKVLLTMLREELGGTNAGGDTYKIYPSAGMDERELAALVSRRQAFRRSAGT